MKIFGGNRNRKCSDPRREAWLPWRRGLEKASVSRAMSKEASER
jgi:hypothetical protein